MARKFSGEVNSSAAGPRFVQPRIVQRPLEADLYAGEGPSIRHSALPGRLASAASRLLEICTRCLDAAFRVFAPPHAYRCARAELGEAAQTRVGCFVVPGRVRPRSAGRGLCSRRHSTRRLPGREAWCLGVLDARVDGDHAALLAAASRYSADRAALSVPPVCPRPGIWQATTCLLPKLRGSGRLLPQ